MAGGSAAKMQRAAVAAPLLRRLRYCAASRPGAAPGSLAPRSSDDAAPMNHSYKDCRESEHQQNVNEPADRIGRDYSQRPQQNQNNRNCKKHRLTLLFRYWIRAECSGTEGIPSSEQYGPRRVARGVAIQRFFKLFRRYGGFNIAGQDFTVRDAVSVEVPTSVLIGPTLPPSRRIAKTHRCRRGPANSAGAAANRKIAPILGSED